MIMEDISSQAIAEKPDTVELKKHPSRFDPNTIASSYSSYEHLADADVVQTTQVDGGAESRELLHVPGPQPLAARVSGGTCAPKDHSLHSDGTEKTTMIPDSFDGAWDAPCSIDGLIAELDSDTEEVDTDSISVEKGTIQAINENLLQTDPILGLSDLEVARRIRKFGYNQLSEEKRNHFKKLLSFFVGPIQFVMEAAFCLALCLRKWIDAGVIASLLILNATVGFVQELQAGNVVNELKKTLASQCVVLRNGCLTTIEAKGLAPGDIVRLEEGSIVPADGRIITEDVLLQVDQSSITGESLACTKGTNDTLYQSSTIRRGDGHMIVTLTGDSTYVGRAAALVNSASQGAGHFTEVLNGIGYVLLVFVMTTLLVVWVASLCRRIELQLALYHTLAITIIGVPVGLPAVVTTTMAVGASYLAKKRAIVQRLSAIESLAGVEILCSDKTGTLTKNKLSMGTPYTVAGVSTNDLMLVACLAATRKTKGLDAIDKAFLRALKSYGQVRRALSSFKVVQFASFDPVSKKVEAIVETPAGERMTCVKGAPLIVLNLVREDGKLNEKAIEDYQDKVQEFAGRGFRSIGVARRRGTAPWELLGIMPCSDPPRDDTAATINEAKTLGLRIKMLTGDAIGIAKETSRQLGLGEKIYNSERLGLDGSGDLPGSKLYDFVEDADGFAEVFPQHKYNVVEILQKRGYLVAMTGDGVNDAPSLKKADTGIAVEGASDAARSAADIVFLEPGLSAIIDALKTSRQIFHRMYAYIVYRIALSFHLLIVFGLWIAIWNDILTLTLAVFLAIFADVATLAIAYDKAPYSLLPVKWNLPQLWGISVILSLILAAGTMICLTTMMPKKDEPLDVAEEDMSALESLLFLQISLTENWLIFITRAAAPWKSLPSWQLASAILLVDIIATLFCHFGLFVGGGRIGPEPIARIWIFSFLIFCAMAVAYYLLLDSVVFDNLVHGRLSGGRKRQSRVFEDLAVNMQRVSAQHEKYRQGA